MNSNPNDGGGNPVSGPRQEQIRATLRVAGPLIALTGLVLIVIGVGSFFSSFASFGPGGFGGPPRYFWCAFLGMPLLGLGWSLTVPGYLGIATRYFAGEVAPVQKDTFNYLAHGTRQGVRDVAEAIGQGLGAGAGGAACPRCGTPAPEGSRFCPGCGAPFVTRACVTCGAAVVPGAKFCHSCGAVAREPEVT